MTPSGANVISSHVTYKVKTLEYQSRMLKALLGPPGNEDRCCHQLRSDCAISSPIGITLLLSETSLYVSRLKKLDVKAAYQQTGDAQGDV